MLTKGLDNVPGTAGNDTIIGSIDNTGVGANAELQTLSNLDIVNGGAGVDTLSINVTGGVGVVLPNMTNVEIVKVESTVGATVDTSTTAGVTNLNVTKAGGPVIATAAATTDVGVSVKGIAGTTVVVNGGKAVNVTTTDAVGTIDAGAAGADVTGAVTISATGAAASNANAAVALGTIAVGGGTTINVTQKATSDASALVAGAAATTHTQGKVTVAAGATTTSVTLKQDAAVAADSVAAVTGATEAASVKFTKLDAGESVTISGLTFTAAAGKNLTADQVAQAFANLSASAIKPTQIAPATTATSDTQGSGSSVNGAFTGALLADWTSGAATGDTVVFTGKANTAMATDLVATAKATVTTTTQGVTAVAAKNVLGVVNGAVDITGAAALKTVTVDGYAASIGANGINGATNNALDTISLANGGNFEIDSAAAALGLTLANVNGTVTVTAGTKTLNAAVSHAKATDTAILVSASAETVNVSGTGTVSDNGTALAAATVINTSAMTAGKATFTVSGIKTTYTGGAGVDTVTVSDAGTPITKAIDLGAGDDTLTLNGAAVAPTATLKGGDGNDTIAMTGARAEALSANATFAGKIEGFEKLHINDTVAAATTVNMANMDGITYVVSNNSAGTAAGATAVYAGAVAGLTQNDTIKFTYKGGAELTATIGATAGATATAAEVQTAINVALAGQGHAAGSVVASFTNAGADLTLTAAGNPVTDTLVGGAYADVDGALSNRSVADAVDALAGAVAATLTLDKMANNGTLELAAAGAGVKVTMADATGSTDSFNIVTKVSAADATFGTVDVAGVETLKLNAVDTALPVTVAGVTTGSINTASLTVKADKATILTIEGNSNVTLTLDATTTKLATIDASTLTGSLRVDANEGAVAMTITGGLGADTLKASVGTFATADVINGGAGNDTIYAGSNGAKLTGGAGNDLFIVTASSALVGNKESNTYSEILDFQAGDVLQLQAFVVAATADATGFTKLAAVLNENTAQFSDFVNAAVKEAGAGAATWFNFKGDAYVVVDSGADTDAFVNGQDLVVKLTGINGDNLSWNSEFATVALV